MNTKKPQPGEWVFVPKNYPSIDPDGVLFGLQHQVIEPGEFEVDGEEYYLQVAHIRVVPHDTPA